ncbi:MAG: hypothetical protein DRJ03_28970 [Chloroflexi bacterium]|nr:MAG: hypothetical protein DRJ03_28970 [Chloroflexota bacterium]
MKESDFSSSNYLKQGDVEPPILVTIKSVLLKNLARDNQPQEMKPVVEFVELDKMFACNLTNFRRIVKETGEQDTDGWAGKKIVLWFNPDVSFGGEQVGGIRVRGAKPQAVQEPVVPDREAALDAARAADEEIPF